MLVDVVRLGDTAAVLLKQDGESAVGSARRPGKLGEETA